MPRIRTDDAKTALREQLREEVKDAAGGNTLVSHVEAEKLDPFVKRAEEALRREGGKGTRVHVDALIDRAAADAVAGWEKFNPPEKGNDSTWLAKAEVAQVRADDPELGALTDRALLRLGRLPTPGDLGTAARAFFDGFDFSNRRLSREGLPGGSRIDARLGQPGRSGVPQGVLDVFDFYHRAEAADWATVSLLAGKIDGRDVFATYMTTDGDDEYLEVMDAQGAALASATLSAGSSPTWDAWPGRARLSYGLAMLGQPRNDEGYSEVDEAVAAGQIPPQRNWGGDVTLDSGFIHHAGGQITGIDLPDSLTPEQRDVATAAFNLLWENVFRHRGDPEPIEIGPRRNGTLVLGTFTRPDDGQTYLVADWRDVDDASFTFYFRPEAAAPVLAISQFNN